MRLLVLVVFFAFVITACSDDAPKKVPAPEIKTQQAKPAPSHAASSKASSQAPKGIFALIEKSHPPITKIDRLRNQTLLVESGFTRGYGFFLDDACTIVTNKHTIEMSHDALQEMKVRRGQVNAMLERGIVDSQERKKMVTEQKYLQRAVETTRVNGRSKDIRITLINGQQLFARVLSTSKKLDLAYLYIKEKGCQGIEYYKGEELAAGTEVFSIRQTANQDLIVLPDFVTSYTEKTEKESISYLKTRMGIPSGMPLIHSNGQLLGIAITGKPSIVSSSEGHEPESSVTQVLLADTLQNDLNASKTRIEQALLSAEISAWLPETILPANEEKEKADQEKSPLLLKTCLTALENSERKDAIEPCTTAANHKIPMAQFLLAEILITDDDKSIAKSAIDLYLLSAQAGYPEALFSLGQMRDNGDSHVLQNQMLAKEYYKDACNKDYARACAALAAALAKNFKYKEAIKLLEKSIALGNINSSHSLGRLYEKGKGIAMNDSKAAELYQQAALLGSRIGAHDMAWLHFKGITLDRSFVKSYAWLIVAEKGSGELPEDMKRDFPEGPRFHLERLMTTEQLQEGQATAKELQNNITKNLTRHEKSFNFRENYLADHYPEKISSIPDSPEAE